jgi:hypothetical protein
VQLQRASDQLEELGVRLVVIGNGLASFIDGFRDKTAFDGELYTDPKRQAFRALALVRGVRSTFSLRGAGKAARAWREGFRQTATRGDPWQQGGLFVIARGGEPVYAYRSQFAGDHPPIEDVLDAARVAADRS